LTATKNLSARILGPLGRSVISRISWVPYAYAQLRARQRSCSPPSSAGVISMPSRLALARPGATSTSDSFSLTHPC
jgi:hypothetical protein